MPPWMENAWTSGDFVSVTRTPHELSIVCPEELVPADTIAERGWRCLGIVGTLDFDMVGVIASLATVLADANISIFVVSTYDTDFLLVHERSLSDAIMTLQLAGHSVADEFI